MHFLEAEVAKVQLGEAKTSTTSVSLLAEAGPMPDVEYFGICELPIFNPAAVADCQRLSESIFSSLRRKFKHGSSHSAFETAMSEVNAVLNSALDQPNLAGFLERINAGLAIRIGEVFSVSACGDVVVLLYRDGKWQEISSKAPRGVGEKVFTSIVTGKVVAGDFVILATSALLESISLDRLGVILSGRSVPEAGSELVKVLEEVGESGLAFGSLIIKFTEKESLVGHSTPLTENSGTVQATGVNLPKPASQWQTVLQKIKILALNLWRKLLGYLHHWSPKAVDARQTAVTFSKRTVRVAGSKAVDLTRSARSSLFSLSRRGIFILAGSIGLVLLIIGGVIWSNARARTKNEVLTQQRTTLANVEGLLNTAESKQIYGDDEGARSDATQAHLLLSSDLSQELQSQKNELEARRIVLVKKIDKVEDVRAERVAVLSAGSHLLSAGQFVATVFEKSLVKFNLTATESTESSSEFGDVVSSIQLPTGKLIVYDGDSLRLWKGQLGSMVAVGESYFQKIPKTADFGGMDFYPVNSRIYLSDNSTNTITSFQVGESGLSAPKQWNVSSLPKDVKDIAIDGNIYLLGEFGLKKYYQGKEVPFFDPPKGVDLTGGIKLISLADPATLYILDPKNERIVILDKQGTLQSVILDSSLKSAKDFLVNKQGQEIYVLSAGSLIKFERNLSAK